MNTNENTNNQGNMNPQNTNSMGPTSTTPVNSTMNMGVETNTGLQNPAFQQPAPTNMMPQNGPTIQSTTQGAPTNVNPTMTPSPNTGSAPMTDANNLSTNPQPMNNGPVMETIPQATVESPTPVNNPTPVQAPVPPQPDPMNSGAMPNQTPPVLDNFNAVPAPPTFEEKATDSKKGNKKMIIIVIIVLLIIGIGFGIYYFLTKAKASGASADIATRELAIELGETLSDNVDDYAAITGYDKTSCTVDTSNIEVDKVGAYKYYIHCGEKEVEGTAIVDDTKEPTIIPSEVVVVPNATVTADDFVEQCIDASKCTVKFQDEEAVKTSLSKIGEYDVELLVSDEYNNEVVTTVKLTVSNNAPVKYLTCTANPVNVDEIYSTLSESYRFGVDSSNNLYNAILNSQFSFDDIEDYKSVKESYSESTGVYNRIGQATFNDENKSIIIKANKTIEEINKDLDLTLSKDINTIQMYLTILGYSCK